VNLRVAWCRYLHAVGILPRALLVLTLVAIPHAQPRRRARLASATTTRAHALRVTLYLPALRQMRASASVFGNSAALTARVQIS